MCAFATIIWSYRSTKIATETELNNQISTKMESLHEKYLAGNLEEIEPNEAMIEIHGHFAAQAEELSKMEELGEDPEAIAGLTNELTRLAEIRHSIDLLRRAEHEVDADKEKTSKTLNKSKWVTFLPLKAFLIHLVSEEKCWRFSEFFRSFLLLW